MWYRCRTYTNKSMQKEKTQAYIDTWYVEGWTADNWRKDGIFKWLAFGQPDIHIHMDKNIKFDLYLMPYIIITSKWVADPNVNKNQKNLWHILEKNIFINLGVWNLNKTQDKKIDSTALIKLRISVHQRHHWEETGKPYSEKNIYSTYNAHRAHRQTAINFC